MRDYSPHRIVFEPLRFELLLAMARGGGKAIFADIVIELGQRHNTLSHHAKLLRAAGLISMRKGFRGNVVETRCSVTDRGRHALAELRRGIDVVLGEQAEERAA